MKLVALLIHFHLYSKLLCLYGLSNTARSHETHETFSLESASLSDGLFKQLPSRFKLFKKKEKSAKEEDFFYHQTSPHNIAQPYLVNSFIKNPVEEATQNFSHHLGSSYKNPKESTSDTLNETQIQSSMLQESLEDVLGDSMHEFYSDWLHVLLEEMRGHDWSTSHPLSRNVGTCSNNLKLKNQGCALFIPLCKKYTLKDNALSVNGWACEMVIWSQCQCSQPYSSFLKYLIPPSHECYGNVLHTYDLASVLHVTVEYKKESSQNDRILIPLGYCGWSGFFLFYLFMVASSFIALMIMLVGFLKRIKHYLVKKHKKYYSLIPASEAATVKSLE